MAGKRGLNLRPFVRALWAALLSLSILLPPVAVSTVVVSTPAAAGNDRTLYLYHTHTHKSGHFTFRRDGKYDPQVLQDLNLFLADWRTGRPTKMDPALFDLLWMVYQEVGASQPINIVSSYREPATNAMLRSKSSGVAENSQHMKGKAMDFFIPGIDLYTLRATAMKYQVGGVGYYPTSGSPFVHLDTGSVRAWPRMTHAQLKKIFPDGRTLHLPTDGKVLSNEGRQYAQAEWNKCHMVPCRGQTFAPDTTLPATGGTPHVMTASVDAPVPATRTGAGLMSATFDLLDGMQVADAGEPAHRVVQTVTVAGIAPVPARKSRALAVATATIPPSDVPMGDSGETALVALAAIGAPVPASRHVEEEPLMVTAYVPAIEPDPGAQLALKMIIERETTGSIPKAPIPLPKPVALEPSVQLASLGGDVPVTALAAAPVPAGGSPLDAFGSLMQATWDVVSGAGRPPVLANALSARYVAEPNAAFEGHDFDLTAPDLEHVSETMVQPVMMSNGFFGEMYEPEGWLDKTTELGPLVSRMGVDPDGPVPTYDRFITGAPLLVATR